MPTYDVHDHLTVTVRAGTVKWSPPEYTRDAVISDIRDAMRWHNDKAGSLRRLLQAVEDLTNA